MTFFLALDVGGTKTDYLLADETHELARVRTGTIKRMRTDAQTATANTGRSPGSLSIITPTPTLNLTSRARHCTKNLMS